MLCLSNIPIFCALLCLVADVWSITVPFPKLGRNWYLLKPPRDAISNVAIVPIVTIVPVENKTTKAHSTPIRLSKIMNITCGPIVNGEYWWDLIPASTTPSYKAASMTTEIQTVTAFSTNTTSNDTSSSSTLSAPNTSVVTNIRRARNNPLVTAQSTTVTDKPGPPISFWDNSSFSIITPHKPIVENGMVSTEGPAPGIDACIANNCDIRSNYHTLYFCHNGGTCLTIFLGQFHRITCLCRIGSYGNKCKFINHKYDHNGTSSQKSDEEFARDLSISFVVVFAVMLGSIVVAVIIRRQLKLKRKALK